MKSYLSKKLVMLIAVILIVCLLPMQAFAESYYPGETAVLDFSSEGGTITWGINQGDDVKNPYTPWTISTNEDWIHLSVTSGSSPSFCTIRVDKNDGSSRVGWVYHTFLGEGTISFKIVQGEALYLSVDTGHVNGLVAWWGGGQGATVNVSSNTDWTVSCSDSWVRVSNSSGSGDGSFTVYVDANEGEARTSYITVSAASAANVKDILIRVTQEANPDYVSCPHENTVREEVKDTLLYGIYETYHTVQWGYRIICKDCGEQIDSGISEPVQEAHKYVKGVCACSKEEPECEHDDYTDKEYYSGSLKTEFSKITETTHDVAVPYRRTCNDCGEVLKEGHFPAVTEKHTFKNGVCVCGAKEAPDEEFVEGEYCPVCKSTRYDDKYDGKPHTYRQNPDGKTHNSYYTANRTCLDCGHVFLKGLEILQEKNAVHQFSVTPHYQYDKEYHWGENTRKCAKCKFVGYTSEIEKTLHSFEHISWEKYSCDDNAHKRKGTAKCTVYGCAYVKEMEEYGPHNWENGACIICSYYCDCDDLDDDRKCDTCGEWLRLFGSEKQLLKYQDPTKRTFYSVARLSDFEKNLGTGLGVVLESLKSIISFNIFDWHDATIGKLDNLIHFDEYSSDLATELFIDYVANYDVGEAFSSYTDAEVNYIVNEMEKLGPEFSKYMKLVKAAGKLEDLLKGNLDKAIDAKFKSDAKSLGISIGIEALTQAVNQLKAKVVRQRIERGIGGVDKLPEDLQKDISEALDAMENQMFPALLKKGGKSLTNSTLKDQILKDPRLKVAQYIADYTVDIFDPDDMAVEREKNLVVCVLAERAWNEFTTAVEEFEENPSNENLCKMRELKNIYIMYARAGVRSYERYYIAMTNAANGMIPIIEEKNNRELNAVLEACEADYEGLNQLANAF